MSSILIQQWDGGALPEGLTTLRVAAGEEGYRFLARLDEECGPDGIFRRPHSRLFWARTNDILIGIGGLTPDPYDNTSGLLRVRHVFVEPESRRSGVGRALALAIVAAATGLASRLTLRTSDERAAGFWESVGFQPAQHATRSHEMNLTKAALPPLQPAR